MQHRLSRTLRAIVLAVLVATDTFAERSRNPPNATVFIRVIGTARVVVKEAFSETREEWDVEFGTGSGFIFTPYGHVLTNYHVIESTTIEDRIGRRDIQIELSVDRIEVVLPGSTDTDMRFSASIEAVDPELDLAVLSIAGGDLPYLAFGDSEAVAQGDAVRVYGFPFGGQVEVGKVNLPDIVPRVSASRGSVAATRTDASGGTAYLQTTATVNPGNSGGPMLDEDGYVLGVVRLKLRNSDGIGFAIPVNAVKDFLTFNGYDQLLPSRGFDSVRSSRFKGRGSRFACPRRWRTFPLRGYERSPTPRRVRSASPLIESSVHGRSLSSSKRYCREGRSGASRRRVSFARRPSRMVASSSAEPAGAT